MQEKKEEIWLSPMTKAPTPTEMSKGQSDNTNNATKKFDYTAVADRLRTVSWSNYSHPTGVVNQSQMGQDQRRVLLKVVSPHVGVNLDVDVTCDFFEFY